MDDPRLLKERRWITSLLRGAKPGAEDLDWDAVFSLCQEERVAPLLYKIIEEQEAPEIPSAFRDHIKAAYLHNHFRNETFLSNLKELLVLFKKENIPMVLLKGAALLAVFYRDPALRPMDDLDLLIREEDLEKAHHLFINAGFLLAEREYWPWWRKFGGSRNYVKNDVLIELHWNLGGPDFPLSTAHVFARAKKIAVSGAKALILSPEDFLLYQLFHAVYHHAMLKLIWLMDIMKITTVWKEKIAWGKFWEKAKALNLAPGVGLGLREAKEALGAYVPEAILRETVSCPKTLARLINFKGESEQKGNLLTLLRIPGLKDKALFLLGAHFPSPDYLRVHYHVSHKRAWLYFFLRPFLVINKAFKALSRAISAAICSSILSRQRKNKL